jgi:hypothetical protein
MASIDQLSHLDMMFFYGELPEDMELEHNLMSGLLQPERSLFYNRSDSVGVTSYENHPNNILLQVKLRYRVAEWINYYNTYTGDGTDGRKERRIAVSQFSIDFENLDDAINMEVFYIPFVNYTQIQSVKVGII